MSRLSYARYGKDNIRLYKVHRDEKTGTQSVVEMTVRILLEGDVETSYEFLSCYTIPHTDRIAATQKLTTQSS